MGTERIADELAIRDLVNRYSDAVVRRDAKAWGDTWAENAEWYILGNSICGRVEIVERWQEATGKQALLEGTGKTFDQLAEGAKPDEI